MIKMGRRHLRKRTGQKNSCEKLSGVFLWNYKQSDLTGPSNGAIMCQLHPDDLDSILWDGFSTPQDWRMHLSQNSLDILNNPTMLLL